jgi:hypothetical protein
MFKIGQELVIKSDSEYEYPHLRKTDKIIVANVEECESVGCDKRLGKGCKLYTFKDNYRKYCRVEKNLKLKEEYINLEL